jgi:eukaryotic-like serine/threonine-protein kinase
MSQLDPALWHAVQPWLDRALDLPAGESRDQLIAALREEAPAIADTLELLLSGEEEPHSLTALGVTITQLLGDLPTLAGQRIGSYVLDAPLGQGGMGTVYLAHRADGAFDGDAAVKLLHVGAVGGARADRFRREATMLATLSHPNIARLLDAGVTDVGQPYLVLEHVAGTRIDRHCAAHALTVEQRLRLMVQVGDAVGAAHARLIVHRDIKPANILVTEAGMVKLLDFGIATLVGAGRGLPGTSTEDSGLALTPEYAAPEQLKREPLTTAVDVYAMGVLLHLLLAGEHPTGAGCTSPAEHLRAVLDVEPLHLSDAVRSTKSRSGDDIARHASTLGKSVGALHEVYRGDLDTIVACALHKNPALRYPSVAALCDDIERYLTHRPITAKPATLGDRARKFVRRHRGAVAGSTLAVASLVGATVFSAQQASIARMERDGALFLSRKAMAQVELQAVLATASTGPDGVPEPLETVVKRAQRALEAEFPEEPRLVAEVLVDLSATLHDAGEIDTEGTLLKGAQRAAEQSGHAPTRALVRCVQAQEFSGRRNDPGAKDSAQAAIGYARTLLTALDEPDLNAEVYCLAAEGALLAASGEADSGAVKLRRAVSLLEVEGEINTTRYAQMLHDLGRMLRAGSHFRDAVVPAAKVVTLFERTGRVETPATARIVANLVQPMWNIGEVTQAHDVLKRLVQTQEKTWGAGRTHSLMAYWYGLSHQYLGQLDSAETWMLRAVADTSADGQEAAMITAPTLAMVRSLVGHDPEPFISRAMAANGMLSRAGAATRVLVGAQMAAYGAGPRQGPAAALAILRPALGTRPDTLPRVWGNTLLFGVGQAIAGGDSSAALQWARALATIAVVDSVSATQSALVGRAEWQAASLLLRSGDTTAARSALARALPALRHGLGAAHPEHVTAAGQAKTLTR